jgi:hypothetical protein
MRLAIAARSRSISFHLTKAALEMATWAQTPGSAQYRHRRLPSNDNCDHYPSTDSMLRASGKVLKRIYLVGLALIILLVQWTPVLGAEIAGRVTDSASRGVEDVGIILKDAKGAIVATAASDKQGDYQLSGLGGGTYSATLDPGKTGYRGTTVAVSVDPKVILCVNWFVSTTAEALAVAQPNNQAGASTSSALAAAACQAPDPPAPLSAGAQILWAGGLGAVDVAALGGIGVDVAIDAGALNEVTTTPPKKSQRRPGD